jgi:hypothetical protein
MRLPAPAQIGSLRSLQRNELNCSMLGLGAMDTAPGTMLIQIANLFALVRS